MKTLEKIVTILVIVALLGALFTTIHTYIDGERWAWYDSGYDDALNDLGITYINGEIYLEDCYLGFDSRVYRGYNYPQEVSHDAH